MIAYKFKGTDTSGRCKYEAYGKSVYDLFNELVEKDIIHYECMEDAILAKNGKTWDDFTDEDGDLDYEKFQEWCEPSKELTDDEVLFLIGEQDSNAYYQTIYKWNEETEEYEEAGYGRSYR